MKTIDELILEIQRYIDIQKEKGIKWIYYPSLEITQETYVKLENHFKDLGYITEFRKCASCLNKADITIGWTN